MSTPIKPQSPEPEGSQTVPTRVASKPAASQTPVTAASAPDLNSLPDESLAPSEVTTKPPINTYANNNNNQGNNTVDNIDHQDVWVRAGKTLVQAFLATWAISGFAFDKSVLVGAVAAAISALWNYVQAIQALS